MSYADTLLATVPAAPPTLKNQRTTSCPAPISANVPYHRGSRLILSALEWVSIASCFTECEKGVYQESRGGDSYIFVKSESCSARALSRRTNLKSRSQRDLRPDILAAYG